MINLHAYIKKQYESGAYSNFGEQIKQQTIMIWVVNNLVKTLSIIGYVIILMLCYDLEMSYYMIS